REDGAHAVALETKEEIRPLGERVHPEQEQIAPAEGTRQLTTVHASQEQLEVRVARVGEREGAHRKLRDEWPGAGALRARPRSAGRAQGSRTSIEAMRDALDDSGRSVKGSMTSEGITNPRSGLASSGKPQGPSTSVTMPTYSIGCACPDTVAKIGSASCRERLYHA